MKIKVIFEGGDEFEVPDDMSDEKIEEKINSLILDNISVIWWKEE